MNRIMIWSTIAIALSLTLPNTAEAQYAVGHRTFGGGTAFGLGYTKWDYQFTDQTLKDEEGIETSRMFYLLPTLELKVFLADTVSLDLSVPVVNIAASNAIMDHFYVTGEAFVNFHPSAPSSWELFVAPGIGFSYASWEDKDKGLSGEGWAFHVPVRIGMELNNARRNFSVFVAVRPFFSLVHGDRGDNSAGGGAFLEIGLMAYAIKYKSDRY
jgi:hypothetical protein